MNLHWYRAVTPSPQFPLQLTVGAERATGLDKPIRMFICRYSSMQGMFTALQREPLRTPHFLYWTCYFSARSFSTSREHFRGNESNNAFVDFLCVNKPKTSESFKPLQKNKSSLTYVYTHLQLWATTDLSTVSRALPSRRPHSEMIWYVASPGWLLSPSRMHLRLPHVSSWPESSFLLRAKHHSIARMCHHVFLCSPSARHLGCFHVWVMRGLLSTSVRRVFCVDVSD